MGCAEFFVALYFDVLNKQVKPFAMDGKGEDLFFLSNGHISPVFYSVLARSGYFPLSELATFRKINSRLQGHPTTHEGLPGIRVASMVMKTWFIVCMAMGNCRKVKFGNLLCMQAPNP